MGFTNIQSLLIINFLHYFSSALVLTVASRHIGTLGGGHILITLIHSLGYICQELSSEYVAFFNQSNKYTLMVSLFSTFICFFSMAYFDSMSIDCIFKCLTVLVSDVLNTSKRYIEKTENVQDQIAIFNTLEFLKMLGWGLGAIFGGYIYNVNQDFTSNSIIASCSILTCILILQKMDDDVDFEPLQTHFGLLFEKWKAALINLKDADFRNKNFLLKGLYIWCFTVYFSRYTFLKAYNYKLNVVQLGYTICYEQIAQFLSVCLVPFLYQKLDKNSTIIRNGIFIAVLLLNGLYFAPSLRCYLLLLLPLFMSYTLVNTLLKDDAFGLKEDGLDEESKTIGVLISIIVPIYGGIACQFFGGCGFKIAACLPIVLTLALVTAMIMENRNAEEVVLDETEEVTEEVQEQQEEEEKKD